MYIFNVHSDIVKEYNQFLQSFINVKNPKFDKIISCSLNEGNLLPDPLIQFNPSFENIENFEEIIRNLELHPDLKKIFKFKLFKHQVEALKLGSKLKDFILTSGTGSGKSLAFVSTIFDYLLKLKNKSKGIKAIIVYPMNALINSQFESFCKYELTYLIECNKSVLIPTDLNTTLERLSFLKSKINSNFPISYAQYTGQEDESIRQKIREEFPDIILTNYMMLELILTRPNDSEIKNSIFENLKFLVFDELHTYRGRQGADVSMLIRRIKSKSKQHIVLIGTSATMVSGGTIDQNKNEICKFANRIFGRKLDNDQIINEHLVRSFNYKPESISKESLINAIKIGIDINSDENNLINNPLAIWLESKIALREESNILLRNNPMTLKEIITFLKNETDLEEELINKTFNDLLLWITNINNNSKNKKYSFLPFKLHQFISQTGTVYSTINQDDDQIITLVNDRYSNDNKVLFPVVFSRISGMEFFCVRLNNSNNIIERREFMDFKPSSDDSESEDSNPSDYTNGYLIFGDDVWSPHEDIYNLPDSWTKLDKNKKPEVIREYSNKIPRAIYFDNSCNFSFNEQKEFSAWFMQAPLLFDPTAGIFYDLKTKESTKLAKLGGEGRSSATTVLSYIIVKNLMKYGFSKEDQKLLSFTDNRQDAALQSGHFNDFIKVGLLRSCIYYALVSEDNKKLDYSNIASRVFEILNLDQGDYASQVAEYNGAIKDNQNALKDFLMYKIILDLKRGWKVILPNLEQCGLIKISYKHLDDICNQPFLNQIPIFEKADINKKKEILLQVLDFFRRNYSIYSNEFLANSAIERNKKIFREKLKSPWTLDDNDYIPYSNHIKYENLKYSHNLFTVSIGYRSAFAKYFRDLYYDAYKDHLNQDSYIKFHYCPIKI